MMKVNSYSSLYPFIDYFEHLQNKEGYTIPEDDAKEDGVIRLLDYNYDQKVYDFFNLVNSLELVDYNYLKSLEDAGYFKCDNQDEFIARANLPILKALLTYSQRGERFCTGFLVGILESKVIAKILRRLQEIEEVKKNFN
jgi:hypothetical protein